MFRFGDAVKGESFHSTKEGFKAAAHGRTEPGIIPFPFHQGRFQGRGRGGGRGAGGGFPFHQGRFQGGQEDVSAGSGLAAFPFHQGRFQGPGQSSEDLRIPAFPFHQGRFQGENGALGPCTDTPFPFHQGRFQGVSSAETRASRRSVSIPPRKVSRGILHKLIQASPDVSIPPRKVSRVRMMVVMSNHLECFHSTKEGFKGLSVWPTLRRSACFHSTKEGFKDCNVSGVKLSARCFHSTKEGFKVLRIVRIKQFQICFHSTKEGFKVLYWLLVNYVNLHSFHSTKEGFKGRCGEVHGGGSAVSIPPRKVSRAAAPDDQVARKLRFHSTKEGFKGHILVLDVPVAQEFPFHQGRFQGGSGTASPPSRPRFPFHQGRFQGPQQGSRELCPEHVSIPPRKVSRGRLKPLSSDWKLLFPFHQGRFQGTSLARWHMSPPVGVSIPPRKVSRWC